MNPNSPTKIRKNYRSQCTHTKSSHNQLEGNSKRMNPKVASLISLKTKLNNKVSKLWKIFQTKHDSKKTGHKDGHYKDEIRSDNEGGNNVAHSISHQSSKQSRARTNRN